MDNLTDALKEKFEQTPEQFFDKLAYLILDDGITDIDFNGIDVWVNHVEKGKYKIKDSDFTERDCEKLAYQISNTENVQFNDTHPILQADLNDLRFQFTHKTFSSGYTTCSIRKTPIVNRIKEENLQDRSKKVEYLSKKANELLKLSIKNLLNIVNCGLTGSGKTELAKYSTKFTNPSDKIITIEDTSELHLKAIYPEKNIVELKINDFVSYEDAIKSCLRMSPVWINLSEARGKEIKELLKAVSTGHKIITTLHCDNAKQIPSRMLNMFEDNELSSDKIKNMIYDYIDLGIHIRADFSNGVTRYVDQIVYFDTGDDADDDIRMTYEIYKVKEHVQVDGTKTYEYIYNDLPDSLVEKLHVDENFAKKWVSK